jgi:hypothetical protein
VTGYSWTSAPRAISISLLRVRKPLRLALCCPHLREQSVLHSLPTARRRCPRELRGFQPVPSSHHHYEIYICVCVQQKLNSRQVTVTKEITWAVER